MSDLPHASHTAAHRLKRAVVRVATSTALVSLFQPMMRRAGVVYMLHRFAHPKAPLHGFDPAILRRLLEYLRRKRYHLVDLEALFSSLRGEQPPPRRAVAFTIDDGYWDQAELAAPLFAEYDCPVTTFVTTGFLDGQRWFWWDQVEYIFAHAERTELTVEVGGRAARYPLDGLSRRDAHLDFTDRCKTVPEAEKQGAIARLADAAGVTVPRQPPAKHRPMTWDELRTCERGGMRFAPHTVTHPILARTDGDHARAEITESWDRLRAEATNPVPIFAYPNGQHGDYGDREYAILREAGFLGAVTGVAGFATRKRHRAPNGPFLVPRFPFPDSLPYLIQQVGGLERLKFRIRGLE